MFKKPFYKTGTDMPQLKTIAKFGLTALAAVAFFDAGLSAKAEHIAWVRAQQFGLFENPRTLATLNWE
jgi:hypothetical protein